MLSARHPGLRDRVDRLLAELWPTGAVKHYIATHYGERISMETLARYKRMEGLTRRAPAMSRSGAGGIMKQA